MLGPNHALRLGPAREGNPLAGPPLFRRFGGIGRSKVVIRGIDYVASLAGDGARSNPPVMFVVTEADVTAVRASYECARAIVWWMPAKPLAQFL